MLFPPLIIAIFNIERHDPAGRRWKKRRLCPPPASTWVVVRGGGRALRPVGRARSAPAVLRPCVKPQMRNCTTQAPVGSNMCRPNRTLFTIHPPSSLRNIDAVHTTAIPAWQCVLNDPPPGLPALIPRDPLWYTTGRLPGGPMFSLRKAVGEE